MSPPPTLSFSTPTATLGDRKQPAHIIGKAADHPCRYQRLGIKLHLWRPMVQERIDRVEFFDRRIDVVLAFRPGRFGTGHHFKRERSAFFRLFQEPTNASTKHWHMGADVLHLPALHVRDFRSAFVSDKPKPSQPFSRLPANKLEFVEQDRAGSAIEMPLDRRKRTKDLPVRPVDEMFEHLAQHGLPAARVLTCQLNTRRNRKLSVDV